VEVDGLNQGLESQLKNAQTLAGLIELAERRLDGTAVEWRAFLKMLDVDPSRVLYKPTGRTEVWRDFEGNWRFSVDPHAKFPQVCERLLYELARARYRGKGYYSSVEVELLLRLARWLAAMTPNYPPNPELVLKPTREEAKRAIELARKAGVELDEDLAQVFERKPYLAVLWALGAFLNRLLAIENGEAVLMERFLFYLAQTSRGGLPPTAGDRSA